MTGIWEPLIIRSLILYVMKIKRDDADLKNCGEGQGVKGIDVYMYVSMYVCITSMYACVHACMYGWMDRWMYICMYVWIDGWMDRCME